MIFRTPLLFISAKVEAFFRLPFMQKLAVKYPKLFQIISRRFTMHHFFGLPFTVLIGILAFNLALLSDLSEDVVNSQKLQAMDRQVSLWLFQDRTEFTSLALFYFTWLGSLEAVLIILFLAAVFFIYQKRYFYFAALAVSLTGSGLSVYFTKLFFRRERPLDLAYYQEHTFSFPSGHATYAVSVFGLLFYLGLVEIKTTAGQIWWILGSLIFILLLGFSRIYLGVHFLTDVVGGYMLGLLWAILAVCVMEFLALRASKVVRKM
jgi:membrane-associated phospholipid phosphatase